MKYETHKLWKSKKGFNDIFIMGIILSIFLLTSILLPFIQESFQQSQTDFQGDELETQIKNQAGSVSSINAFTLLLTFLKLSFWDFGNTLGLPFWIDGLYTVLAIVLVITVSRNIWIGGGA